ncbi:Plasmodium exported protein, unknown function [Plasmodium chabaudi chabaudi]|uniref:Fam-b protein n=1 Tax=Plasmodium chabaudi chabaudi TaxID=31271 RepID=A0A1C6WPF4_PLACU|nr:Plasmodium exported protein, unknown function [Plasmodium chabaudi chabaudi]
MGVNILNFVFFSIICFFGYGKNELYFINERNIYLERNIIYFRNNRILTDADKQFDLYDFYQSTSSLANQFNDYNDDDDKITNLRNIINSHIRKHKENNTLPNLNNVDKKTKKLIYELQKELEETKKELDNIRNDELAIQLIHDKKIIKKYKSISVSKRENLKQLENEGNFLETEDDDFEDDDFEDDDFEDDDFEDDDFEDDYFEADYNEVISSKSYEKYVINRKLKKSKKRLIIKIMLMIIYFLGVIASGALDFLVLIVPCVPFIFCNWRKINKYRSKL